MLGEKYLASEIYCNPVGDFVGSCLDDIQAILLVVFCVWAIFWGVPLILHRVGSRSTISRRSKRRFRTRGARYYADEEKGEAGYIDADPPPARPNKLRKPHLLASAPALRRPSPQNTRANIRRGDVNEYIAVKTRLAHFRFPAPDAPPTPRLTTKPLPPLPSTTSIASVENMATVVAYVGSAAEPMLLDWDCLPPALPDSPTIPPTLFACSGDDNVLGLTLGL